MEATGSGCSVTPLSDVFAHASHLIHAKFATTEQVITESSGSRQQRLNEWLETQAHLDGAAAKAILSDQHNAALPIYRLSPDDPDEENTLATAVFILDNEKTTLQVFTLDRHHAARQYCIE
ncbi:hypothetical protein HA38_00860 [Pantoea allii]|nr:hypothetical protein HA38_00860 [Pantoea allii]